MWAKYHWGPTEHSAKKIKASILIKVDSGRVFVPARSWNVASIGVMKKVLDLTPTIPWNKPKIDFYQLVSISYSTVLHDDTNTSHSLRPTPTWLGPVEIGVCTYKWSELCIQRNTRSATLSIFLGYVPCLLLLDGLIGLESSQTSPFFPSWTTLPCSSPQRLTQTLYGARTSILSYLIIQKHRTSYLLWGCTNGYYFLPLVWRTSSKIPPTEVTNP